MTIQFDAEFHCEGVGCFLWADEPTYGRVRFSIGSTIIVDVLGGENPVCNERNKVLVTRERQPIQEACRRAFASRPDKQIELEASDFRS